MLIVIIIILGVAIWIDLPTNQGFFGKKITTRLGLDLVGGVQALLEADLPPNAILEPDAMKTAASIIENRVNGLGVSEAVVQLAGERRIVVELPGEKNPENAINTLKQTALLEFVDFSSMSPEEAYKMDNVVIVTDYGRSSETSQTITNTQSLTQTMGSQQSQIFHTVMNGSSLKTVSVQTNDLGEPEVVFALNSEGAKIFSDFTSTHVGQILAIVLDKTVISAPRIQNPITDGSGLITGKFTVETANELAVQLRSGSLPLPLKVIETRTVGPTLGQDSLRKSMIAGIVGFIVVILFMGLYYRLPGLIADLAIIIFAIITFAIFRFIPVTLTLPGIAGFLLSTGSALDANILIFERLKEELRAGRNLSQAIELGWQRAWPSIRDSNIATLITCAILFWFGSQYGATIVKGFSLTLALGIGVSLFTAIVVSRTLLNLLLNFLKPSNLARWFGI
jgi:preprotein translocase subunit SecD